MKKLMIILIMSISSLGLYAQTDTIPPSMKPFPPDTVTMKQDSMRQGIWPDTMRVMPKDGNKMKKEKKETRKEY